LLLWILQYSYFYNVLIDNSRVCGIYRRVQFKWFYDYIFVNVE